MSKVLTKYSKSWESNDEFKGWITSVKGELSKAKCLWCNSEFSVGAAGINDVRAHAKRNKHVQIVNAKIATKSAVQYFGSFSIDLILS